MYRNMTPNVATQPTPLIDYSKAGSRFTVVIDFWYYYFIFYFISLWHIFIFFFFLFYNFIFLAPSYCTILHAYRNCIHLHVMCPHYFIFLARTVFRLFHIFVWFSPFYLLALLTYLVQPHLARCHALVLHIVHSWVCFDRSTVSRQALCPVPCVVHLLYIFIASAEFQHADHVPRDVHFDCVSHARCCSHLVLFCTLIIFLLLPLSSFCVIAFSCSVRFHLYTLFITARVLFVHYFAYLLFYYSFHRTFTCTVLLIVTYVS